MTNSMGLNWTRVREVVAFLGVVASLAFVGLEIRQNTAATRGQTRQELAALNQEWLLLLSTDEDFLDLWNRAWGQEGEVKPEEEYRANFMMALNVRRMENVFFQYQEGLVDESALRSYGLQKFNGGLMSQPRFQEWWAIWRPAFHPDFVAFLETRVDLD